MAYASKKETNLIRDLNGISLFRRVYGVKPAKNILNHGELPDALNNANKKDLKY